MKQCANGLLEEKATGYTYFEDDENTSLHLAAMYGYTTIGMKLIKNGTELDKRNKEGKTALELSILGENSRPRFSEMLIRAMKPER